MPIWMLLAFAGKADAGFFANAWKFLSLPAALLMPTLGLWLYRTWMENEQEQGKRIAHFFRQIWLPSALLGLVLTLLVMYIAEPLLVVLLGPDWRGVGVFGIYLAPIGYMLALYVPIEPLFKIHRKQQWFLIFSSFQLLLRGAIFSIGLQVLSIESTLLAFVLAEALLFLFYLIKARQWVFPLRSQAN
jgi:O-antigen/teichoic acid export membrane protein